MAKNVKHVSEIIISLFYKLKYHDRLDRFLSKDPIYPRFMYTLQKVLTVIGDVVIGDYSSIWFNSVLRADINFIRIGKNSNIQDGVVGHLSDDYPLLSEIM